jgi:hypothetical protein
MVNPSIRQTSHQIEGVRIIQEMDHVPFHGGMDIVRETYQLPLASYSNIQNMRPLRPGFRKRKGQIVLHTTPDDDHKVMSLYGFSKGMQSEIKTFAQMSDGDVLLATANPPAVTTGAFGSTVHTSESPSTMYPASWATLDDMLYYTDGTGHPYVYPGDESRVRSFIVYKSDAAIPVIPTSGIDYTFDVSDQYEATVAVLDSLGTLAQYDAVFIRTLTPANTFIFTMSGAEVNSNAAVAQMHYWNGGWAACTTGWDDTTAAAGATLSKDGIMTYTMPTDVSPHYMFGETGYWVRLSLASGSLSASVDVEKVTYESTWTAIQNVWDGATTSAIEAFVYIASSTTYEFYSGSSIDLPAHAIADKIYFNSYQPIIAFYVSVGSTPNENASTMSLKYSTGVVASATTFTAVSGLSDGSAVGSITMAKDGWVTFNHPSDEQPGLFQSSNYVSYWYELSYSASLAVDMVISIETMPYLDLEDFGLCYALSTFKKRMAYSFENLPGYIAISGTDRPSSLNGSDFFIQDIGDGRSNKAVCLKRFYNELLVWQEEKGTEGGCLTLIEGYSAQTFGKRIISTLHGTFSAKSAIVCEDIPTSGKLAMTEKGVVSTDTKIHGAFFLSRDGIFMTDGKSDDMVSGPIQDYFDPKKPECIRLGYEKDHWISWDSTYQIVRVGLVSGQSATAPNVFLIYDIRSRSWSHDVLGQELSSHCEVEAASGFFPLLQIGGGTNDGTVYLLNQTNLDVSVPIIAFVVMEFDGNGHILHLEEIVIRASGACQLLTYADGTLKSTIDIVG